MKTDFFMVLGREHSGTSFLAGLLWKLGYDFGSSPNLRAPGAYQGHEHGPLQELFFNFSKQQLTDGVLEAAEPLTEEMIAPYRSRVGEINKQLPQAVKAPWTTWFLHWWLAAGGRKPDLAAVSFRQVDKSVEAEARKGFSETRQRYLVAYGSMFQTLVLEDIPFYTVRFPESVYNPEHVWVRLPFLGDKISWADYKAVHSSFAKPERVHIR